jgi:cell division septal protein FtsQ
MPRPEQNTATLEWRNDDQSSPYRRRERPVVVRRKQGGIASILLRVALLDFLLPSLVIYGVYRGSLRAARSSCLQLDPETDVSLAGNHFVPKGRVFDVLGFDGKAGAPRITALNLAAERNEVEDLPWVKSATVSRIFPHRLEVKLIERQPVAFANVSGRIELVDADGMFLQIPAKTTFDFPVLYGLDSVASKAERKDRLDLYMEFLKETRNEIPGSGWVISEGDCSSRDDLQLLLVQGSQTIRVHFGNQDFAQSFETFVTLAPRVLQNYSKIDSMDLRYRNEAVIDPVKGIIPGGSAKGVVERSKPRRHRRRKRSAIRY